VAEVYRPIDVLEKQVDMVRWWLSSQWRHNISHGFQNMANAYITMKNDDGTTPPVDMYIAERLDNAETFFVRSPIIDRLWHFTDVYEAHDHEVILPQDLPCPRGYIFLEKPIHLLDARGKVTSVKVILWSEELRGVTLCQFSDAKDPLDEVNKEEWAQFGREAVLSVGEFPLLHLISWTWGRKITNLTPDEFQDPEKMARFHSMVTPIETYAENMDSYALMTNRFNGFIVSLWEFVQEQIPYRIPADRPMRKRLQRAHSQLTEVTVIDLRTIDQPPQYQDPDHVPQTIMWAGRWRVREHKRRWIDKHGNYRETTVAAHVKGPEHLPLIEKDRVFHVKR
jgi:hypothetical protein